jgi:hypothetical protein
MVSSGKIIVRPHAQKTVEEGRHTGKITRTEISPVRASAGGTVDYLDVYVLVDGTEVEIKIGCPLSVGYEPKSKTPTTRLARVCAAAGLDITATELDLSKLLGKKISFVTVNEIPEGSTIGFARVQENSLLKA